MKSNIKKNFVWNLLGSTINSATSLLFLIIVTRINGEVDAGIFTFGFSTACLLQVIATYYGRAYQVTETNKKYSNYDFIYSRYISCIVMILCAFFFTIVKGYLIYKTIVILLLALFKMVEAYSEVVYAIIQKNDDLYKVGISLFLKAIFGTFIFLLLDIITKNVIISILGLILVNILLLIFYDVKNTKKYKYEKTKFNFENIKLLFKSGFYTFLFTFLTQYIINAPRYAIDNNMIDKYQTIFGIIVMPATLIILCGQFLIHPFLVKLTNYYKEKDIKNFTNLVIKISLSLLSLGLLACLAAYFIGIPFLEILYGVNLDGYTKSLIIIIIGATLFALSYIISNALIVMRKTLIQSIIFIISSVFAYFISRLLVIKNGVEGASYSYLFTMLLVLILYLISFIIYIVRYNKENSNESSISNSTSI